MNQGHELGDRIYVVEQRIEQNGIVGVMGTSPFPIGPAVASELPQVEKMVRMTGRSGVVYGGELSADEWVEFSEPGFFELFDFPMALGDASVLADPEAVIISDAIARKYFPGQNPMGPADADFRGEPTTNFVAGTRRCRAISRERWDQISLPDQSHSAV